MDSRRCPAGCTVALLGVLGALGPLAACKRAQPPGAGPQPQKAAAPAAFSAYTPQQSYRQLVPGLLTQTAYVADKGGRYGVEIWDLLVGPGKKSGAAKLPGAAVFEVRSGQGVVTVAGKSRDVRIGATFAVDEAEEFTIENRSPDAGMAIRVTLIRRP